MKFNEQTMQQATNVFMNKKFWRELYEGASETAKKRLRVAFWASQYLDEKEDLDAYREFREAVEREMTYEDAAYLAERFPEGPGKDHYSEMRDNLELAPMKTPEKLDAATEILMEGWSTEDYAMVEKTKLALKHCEEPWVKYEWIWGAVGGNGDDCEWLGDTFQHGHGVSPDAELAFFWFRRGALCGWGDACARLAAIYEEEGPRFDMEKSKFFFAEGLRRKSNCAKIDLGARLTTKEGPWSEFRNPELGVKLLQDAVKREDGKRAHYFLGKCYEDGVGVDRDLAIAQQEYWYAERAEIWGATEALARVKKLRREEKRRDRELAEALSEAFGLDYDGGTEVEVARVCCQQTEELKPFANGSDTEVLAAVREYLRKKIDG